LTADHDSVICAALERAELRTKDHPTFALIRLLGHKDPEIHKAALRALPPSFLPSERDMLILNIDHGTELAGQNSMRALAKVKIDDEVESVLMDKLGSVERETRLLALDLLSTKTTKLKNPTAVWSPARMASLDDHEHARSLLCMERTGSFHSGRLKDALVLMSPLPRYMAARCLVTAGDKHGVSVLLDLLEELEDVARQREEGETSVDDDPVLIAVRRLLGHMSRTGEYSDAEAWREWYENLGRFIPRELGPPPFELK
jgi:hypothetical protein